MCLEKWLCYSTINNTFIQRNGSPLLIYKFAMDSFSDILAPNYTPGQYGSGPWKLYSWTIWSWSIIWDQNLTEVKGFMISIWRAYIHPWHITHLHYWLPFAILLQFKSHKICSYCVCCFIWHIAQYLQSD